jgi:peptidyl-prolyl cis-trans isomerase SurA
MRNLSKWLVVAVLLGGLSLRARAELANGIKAIVNDSIITYQQVELFIAQAEDMVNRRYQNQPEQYRKEMARLMNDGLEQLLQRELILHDFQSSGFNVPETIIDEIVQDRIKERYADRVQFTKQLQREGLTFEEFRKQVRDELVVSEMRRKFVPEPIISPHKIEAYYQSHQDDYKVEDQVKLRMIVLNVTAADAPGATRKRAEEILSMIKGGAAFEEIAKSYSEGSQKGGDTGWQDLSVVLKPLADATKTLQPGQYSDVIETPEACFIVQLVERRPSHVKPLNDLRDEIEKTLAYQEQSRVQKAWMERLKKKTFVRYF